MTCQIKNSKDGVNIKMIKSTTNEAQIDDKNETEMSSRPDSKHSKLTNNQAQSYWQPTRSGFGRNDEN